MKGLFVVAFGCLVSLGQEAEQHRLCDILLTRLIPARSVRLQDSEAQRLEIRTCVPSRILQVVAFSESSDVPAFFIDTHRTSISTLVMAGDVIVLETAGASSNVLQVFVFPRRGAPQMVFEDAFKAYATVETAFRDVKIRIGAGNRARVLTYPTGRE